MKLKKLTNEDEDQVAELLSNYWNERGMPQYDKEWAKKYLVEGHKKEIANDEFFVYQEDNKTVGVVSLITDVSGVAEIRDLVVKQELRGKGYGTKMVTEIIALSKERKIRKLFLLSFLKYEKFLSKLGFEKEGLLKNHFMQGEDLVIMSKFL